MQQCLARKRGAQTCNIGVAPTASAHSFVTHLRGKRWEGRRRSKLTRRQQALRGSHTRSRNHCHETSVLGAAVRLGTGAPGVVPYRVKAADWLVWGRRLGASSPPPRTVNLGATTNFTTHPLQHTVLIAEASVYVPSTFRSLRNANFARMTRTDGRAYARMCACSQQSAPTYAEMGDRACPRRELQRLGAVP